ncbi:MAG TPA: hypothetical protein VM681_05675, partial [Candidatus Thermoplasmatota archaeon]|nr:hypothetical protein [Candidatus Thermoplasmatota archaeon]
GETVATMTRAGLGLSQNDAAGSWSAALAAAPGDSGSAVVTCAPDASGGLRGVAPVGILTHLGGGSAVVGTTVAKARTMALQAGIQLHLLYETS